MNLLPLDSWIETLPCHRNTNLTHDQLTYIYFTTYKERKSLEIAWRRGDLSLRDWTVADRLRQIRRSDRKHRRRQNEPDPEDSRAQADLSAYALCEPQPRPSVGRRRATATPPSVKNELLAAESRIVLGESTADDMPTPLRALHAPSIVRTEVQARASSVCIQMLGSDAPQSSGKSMLLGGLSKAISARVPEPIYTFRAAMG